MTDYQVEMIRAPGLSEAERKRRLHEAFGALWEERKTPITGNLGGVAETGEGQEVNAHEQTLST